MSIDALLVIILSTYIDILVLSSVKNCVWSILVYLKSRVCGANYSMHYLVWFERFALNMTKNYVNVYIKKNKDNIWCGWFVKIMWEFFSPSNKTENRISVHDHEFL